ncbi:MAG TPA: hypothetical protein VL133_15035 [Devosia sp.]|nr:hypothetical protein [Devosia sp.]
MSIVNVVMERERALIGFDTLSSAMQALPDGVPGVAEVMARFNGGIHMSKCLFLPHANVALAHRGDAMLAVSVGSAIQLAALSDFDAIVEAMPQLLAQSFAQVTALRKQQLGIEQFAGAEVILVGWSPALKRMEAVRWLRWPQDNGFAGSPVGHALLLPDAEWEQTPDVPDSAEQMERIARDQVAYVRAKHAGYNCGGRLLLAELTRDTLSVRTIADLEAPPQGVRAVESLDGSGS